MIHCEKCLNLFHCSCIQIDSQDIPKNFICSRCKNLEISENGKTNEITQLLCGKASNTIINFPIQSDGFKEEFSKIIPLLPQEK